MNDLIEASKENQRLMIENDQCDKYDYLIAVGCGAIGGLVDIFLVGAPGDSVLGKWTDGQVDEMVKKFAKWTGWNPREKNKDNVKSAIGHLERTFKVNYDQRLTKEVEGMVKIEPRTHHMKSLAHSPDIVGLFFSILNQFTSTATFFDGGKPITINTETYELQGGNFIMKILCGIANWFGHIMSDVAGGSGSHNRGMGLVMPFYEFFGLCKFGNFKTLDSCGNVIKKDLAEIAIEAYTKGYDLRFGMTQSIPVMITDLSIRLLWAIRRRFQYQYQIKDCIPTNVHPDLRVMIIVGNGTLCVMDGIDAGLRSGGNNYLAFFMRLNYVAWLRLVSLVVKEVCIRIGVQNELASQLAAYERINTAIDEYMDELRDYDIAGYELETARYNTFADTLSQITTQEDLTQAMLDFYDNLDMKLPWTGDFDDFMSNSNNQLVFE